MTRKRVAGMAIASAEKSVSTVSLGMDGEACGRGGWAASRGATANGGGRTIGRGKDASPRATGRIPAPPLTGQEQ